MPDWRLLMVDMSLTGADSARSLVFNDEEFKRLQSQMSEITEKNKHNFEESQKFQREVESLSKLLVEQDKYVELCKEDLDRKNIEIANLNKRISELESALKSTKEEHDSLHSQAIFKDEEFKLLQLQVDRSVQSMPFREFVINNANLIQLEKPITRASAAQSSIPNDVRRIFPCTTDKGKPLWDSLVSGVCDKLSEDLRWDGFWSLDDVQVVGWRCHLKATGRRFREQKMSKERRALGTLRAVLWQHFQGKEPPFLDYLLDLLDNLPADFDVNIEARDKHIFKIRNSTTFASAARVKSLLSGYAQGCKSAEGKAMTNHYKSLIQAKDPACSRFEVQGEDWIVKVKTTTLLKSLSELKKKKKKRKRQGLENSVQTEPEKEEPYVVTNIYPDKMFHLRNVCAHFPEVLVNAVKVIEMEDLDDEIIYLTWAFFRDAIPKLVEFVMFYARFQIFKKLLDDFVKR